MLSLSAAESGNVNPVRLGIFGAGTVGRGLIDLIHKNTSALQNRASAGFEIVQIADRSFRKKDYLKPFSCTDDWNELIENPEIDIFVELIGGIQPARDFILAAIEKGKPVVTANKALLAQDGPAIFERAFEKQTEIGFEAAVAGALPVIRNFRRMWLAGRISELSGILNGTCNFILTRMEEGMDYEEALSLAQQEGFAEADPSFDVGGRDAAQKLAILGMLAFDGKLTEADVQVEGIENIKKVDIDIAKRMNRVIRLLGTAHRTEKGVVLGVHPAMIPDTHTLASVRNEYNAVFVDDEYSGKSLVMGKGAGALPTASAVLSDIAYISRNPARPEKWLSESKAIPVVKDTVTRFYIRFRTPDTAGVLASISKILADFDISIASMHQEEGPEPVDVVIVTHEASESRVKSAMERIDQSGVTLDRTVAIRVEDHN